MRSLTFSIFFFLTVSLSAQTFFEKTDLFFSKYVDEGNVNYSLIKKEPKQLKELVNEIANLDLSNKRVTPEYLKAFYINAYNLLVIKQVVDLYPIEGPLKVDGFFDGTQYKVMGEDMTLDRLEKEILYQQFPDPRLHFVLVCAAKGCPPLAEYSYKPTVLEKQLTDRTRTVLNLDWFIRVNNKRVEISQLFDWYKGDFTKSNSTVVSYINKYKTNKIDERRSFGYYEYDWSLNDQK